MINGIEVTRTIERYFGVIMDQYGIKFMRTFMGSDDIFYYAGPDYIVIPLAVEPRGVVEALVINERDTMLEIEIHIVRIIELIRARQMEDGLGGYIFGQNPPVAAGKVGVVRRIKKFPQDM